MGGGTGTGAAPVVAETAHDLGILTVGIVTKPFAFEGKRKMSLAEQGIAPLMMHVDSLIVIPNERLKLISQERITLMNAFEAADNVLRQGVESISSLINIPAFINLDFADVRSIMKDAGFATWCRRRQGRRQGRERRQGCHLQPAAGDQHLRRTRCHHQHHFQPGHRPGGCRDRCLHDHQSAHPDANIIWGTAFDERLSDEMSITVVATGFESTPRSTSPSRPMSMPSAVSPLPPPSSLLRLRLRPRLPSPHSAPLPRSRTSTPSCPTPSSPSPLTPSPLPSRPRPRKRMTAITSTICSAS